MNELHPKDVFYEEHELSDLDQQFNELISSGAAKHAWDSVIQMRWSGEREAAKGVALALAWRVEKLEIELGRVRDYCCVLGGDRG